VTVHLDLYHHDTAAAAAVPNVAGAAAGNQPVGQH